jgi:hypothetical protein
MSHSRSLLLMAASAALLAGCGRADPQVISQCRQAATQEARGHPIDPSDVGELIEACMMSKGFAVREDGPDCADDITGPLRPICYYPNTVPGRIGHFLRQIL